MGHDWYNYCVRHVEEARTTPWRRKQFRHLLGSRAVDFFRDHDLPFDSEDKSTAPHPPPNNFIQVPAAVVAVRVNGFGIELKALLGSLGVHALPGCGCGNYVAKMNAMTLEQVQARREEIISWLKTGYKDRSWLTVVTAAVKGSLIVAPSAIMGGLDGVLNWLLDEAIRRHQEKRRTNY